MLKGYAGSILYVDATTGKSTVKPTPESLARDYVGGRGFVARLLWDEIPRGTDPLSAENRVVMAVGPLNGVYMPGSGKVHFGTKSPATGGYGDSNMGGHIAAELKQAGFDAVVIKGIAASPSLLVIDDGKIELRDASAYWGMNIIDTESALKRDLGEDFQIAAIGPAGERLVNYACIGHDFGRQAGRSGVGTVLGSKRIKAIVVRGTKSVPLADPRAVLELGKEMYRACYSKPGFTEWTPEGTAGVTNWANEVGAFPTHNFKTSYFPGHKEINGKALVDRIKVTDKACYGCPIPCGKYSRVKRASGDIYVEGPEYETVALIGGNTEQKSIEDVAYLNYLCDQFGLDTISTGSVVAFALECLEKGLLKASDFDGRDLKFGNPDDFEYIVRKIVNRDGIGDLLAQGTRAAAEKIGPEAMRIAIQVKGLEWSGYEARYAAATMLSYITSDTGAHHSRSWAITYDVAKGRDSLEGKAERTIELQHIRPMFDLLCCCRLQWVEIGFELEWYPKMFAAVTGNAATYDDLMFVSERVWNLTRAFWQREVGDFGRKYDYPPARFMEEPVPDGPAAGHLTSRETVDALLDRYYDLRGWDRNGLPLKSKLESLGLGDVARALAN